jgi:PAS domain S-box-containing protein
MPDRNLNILAASSSDEVQERARAALTGANNWSVTVTAAASTESVLAQVREAAPDLLLLDVTDPNIDPLRLVQELEAGGPIPFGIVLLAGATAGATPLAAGAYDFVDVETMAPDLLRHVVLSAIERASLQRELQAVTGHFRQLADAAAVLIWVAGVARGCTFVNKAWLAFTGRTMEQEIGDGWLEGVHPDDRAGCLRVYETAFAAHAPFRMEYRLRRHDGVYRWILHHGQPRYFGPANEFAGFTGSCVDIHSYKEMENALRASEADAEHHLAHLEAIYATAPVGLGFTDLDHRYTHVNERLAAFAGLPAAEMVGRRVDETLPPELAEQAIAIREQVLATGEEVRNADLKGPASDDPAGGHHWLGSYYPVYDAEGHLLGVNTVIVDVTAQVEEQQELEAMVRARTAQVRQLATDLTLAEHRERRRIARVLHDDIQQKLYALQVYIHLIGEEASTLRDEPETAGTMALIGQLIDELIEDNSSLSVELSPPIISHQGLLDAIGWLRQYIALKHRLDIQVTTEGDVDVADPDLREVIFQMVRELLLNVAYHAGVGEAQLLLRRAGERLVIRVEDKGSGFDPAAALGDGDGSPALGLRTLRERADLFGGSLRIVSRPGAGTRISLTMPAVIG